MVRCETSKNGMAFFVLAKRFLSDYYAATPQMAPRSSQFGAADETPIGHDQWKLP